MIPDSTDSAASAHETAFGGISRLFAYDLCGYIGEFESIHSMMTADECALSRNGDQNSLLESCNDCIVFSGPRADVAINGNPLMYTIVSHTRYVRIKTDDFEYLYQVASCLRSFGDDVMEIDASNCPRMNAQLAISLISLPNVRKLSLMHCPLISGLAARSIIRSLLPRVFRRQERHVFIDFSETPAARTNSDELNRLNFLASQAGVVIAS